jgi:DNA-binding NarL/FixJ family response regulator
MEIRLGLVSPRLLVRAAFRCLLEARGLEVVGEAGTHAEAHALIAAEQPDVVLIEFDIATDTILPVLPELLAASERTRILLLTAVRDARIHENAVELGASGLVFTDHGPDVLVKAIEKVHAGEFWLDRALTAGVLSRLTRGRSAIDPEVLKIQSLTRREREIVALVGEGLKNRHIGDRLCISEATARNHMTSILDKLDLDDRFELAVYAFRHGLVAYPRPLPSAMTTTAESGIR